LDITVDHFELFGLAQTFNVSQPELSARFRELQSRFHPDKFASLSTQEQRLAMQYSTHINDAYQCLKSPLSRAAYLLSLRGVSADFGARTISDGAFLMQQMEWREELSDIAAIADIDEREEALEVFRDALRGRIDTEQSNFVQLLEGAELEKATDSIARMHFLFKLDHEAEELEAQLDED
jgi:molecular chaperone HscB